MRRTSSLARTHPIGQRQWLLVATADIRGVHICEHDFHPPVNVHHNFANIGNKSAFLCTQIVILHFLTCGHIGIDSHNHACFKLQRPSPDQPAGLQESQASNIDVQYSSSSSTKVPATTPEYFAANYTVTVKCMHDRTAAVIRTALIVNGISSILHIYTTRLLVNCQNRFTPHINILMRGCSGETALHTLRVFEQHPYTSQRHRPCDQSCNSPASWSTSVHGIR